MPSITNSGIQVRVASQPSREAAKVTSTLDSAPNQRSGCGEKRKPGTNNDGEDTDEVAFSSLAPPAKIARRRAAAVSSTAMTPQTANTAKKVTFAPESIASTTAINVRTFAGNNKRREGSPEQEPPLPVSHTTFPAPTTSQGPSTPSSSSLQKDDDAALAEDASLAEHHDEKRRLLQALWGSEQTLSQLHAQNNESREDGGLIPRPSGEKGKNGWNMQEALRLKENGDLYNEILATTRTAVSEAGLDWTLKFRAQDLEKLMDCYARVNI
ncbi:hypothetical protein FS837_011781 [Tulasnella sp. UAMH 9824]|nr:hypothetical protein FS837_011781 [Tulasnella sp. UAMH 9824]